MHDPEVFPEPHVFRPERFIRGGKLDVGERDPAAFVFGFGRRHVFLDFADHFSSADLHVQRLPRKILCARRALYQRGVCSSRFQKVVEA